MDENILKELKQALEKEKKVLTEELRTIANPDKDVKGDWDARYQNMGDEPEDNAQEVTEYATRLPLEHELELKLQDIDAALKRAAEGTYGICEKCGDVIDIERLKAEPAARTCIQHAN